MGFDGHEGAGPEHSYAYLSRFLALCAVDNMQVCQPSTAGQYFHLLRRQALRKWRKPLIVFTPKSMLRHPEALSPLSELERPRFLNVIPDETATDAKRVLICSGKIGQELRMERKKQKTKKPPLFRVLLHNDDFTSMEFVVFILKSIFRKADGEAKQIMLAVHHQGIGVAGVFTYEIAETKVTQVMDFARKHQHPLQCVMEKK